MLHPVSLVSKGFVLIFYANAESGEDTIHFENGEFVWLRQRLI
jgi:hypothetical protein